jgi:hypothetical protein
LDLGIEQIAIFIGELFYMLLVTSQVKHLMLFPGIQIHQNMSTKMFNFVSDSNKNIKDVLHEFEKGGQLDSYNVDGVSISLSRTGAG